MDDHALCQHLRCDHETPVLLKQFHEFFERELGVLLRAYAQDLRCTVVGQLAGRCDDIAEIGRRFQRLGRGFALLQGKDRDVTYCQLKKLLRRASSR